MSNLLSLGVLLAVVSGFITSPLPMGISATISADGSIVLSEGQRIPPFPASGRWTDLGRKSSNREEVYHFNFMAPGVPPAIELYLSDMAGAEPSDGAFEMGLVRGYVRGFSSKIGFTAEDPTFDPGMMGSHRILHTLVKMSDGKRSLWVYAYIFPGKKPSLTFIAIRPGEGEAASVEQYLGDIELRR